MDPNADQKANKPEQLQYSLILFVISDGANSIRAKENLEQLCEKMLPQPYEIRVVDVVTDFQTALDYNILVTPSVVVTSPSPQKIIHGDLSDARKFAEAMNLSNEDNNDR